MTGSMLAFLFRVIGRARRARNRRPAAKADAGFSLVEVLVAFSVAAFTLAIYFDVLGRAAAASKLSKDRLMAAAYAQSKLSQLDAMEPLVEGTSRGRFDDEFSWEATISGDENSAEARANGVLRPINVTLDVSWKQGRVHRRVSYRALRLVPRTAASP